MSLKKQLFETKEKYLAFRKTFANAVNDDRAKHHFEPCDQWFRDPVTYRMECSKGTGKERTNGWMQSEHFLFLNIVRELPCDRGFGIITSKNKLENGFIPHEGLYVALRKLKSICLFAQRINRDIKVWDTQLAHLIAFIEPFKGTVRLEMLSKIYDLLPDTPSWKTEDKFLASIVDIPNFTSYNSKVA